MAESEYVYCVITFNPSLFINECINVLAVTQAQKLMFHRWQTFICFGAERTRKNKLATSVHTGVTITFDKTTLSLIIASVITLEALIVDIDKINVNLQISIMLRYVVRNIMNRFPRIFCCQYKLGKKFGHLCLVDYFSIITMLIGIVFYIVGKPVCLPLQWCPTCKDHAFVG